MQKQYTKNCPYCGSDAVYLDAYAEWDTVKQKWELLITFDDALCNDCGKTFDRSDIETKEVESDDA